MNESVLGTRHLKKTYHDGTSTVEVLKGIDLTIAKGDRVAIIGRSGSGKSTLLHLLGGLDKPTEGEVLIGDTNWQTLNEKQRCRLRNQRLGFVYQFHHLLPEFTALENVAMPLLLAGVNAETAAKQAESMLEQVELRPRLSHKPSQLSGGERQRVAIARALVHQPDCVLADEPTGNLDQTTAQKVFDLMLALNQQLNTAIVIVTHDQQLAERMDRILVLQEGRLI
jgi:lipoprotein-releasing system ATP-binding protein